MEGRVLLKCSGCGRTRQMSGEMPGEYTRSFAAAVHEEGWVPRPGANEPALICGQCLLKYSGHETMDDEAKVHGDKGPKEL